jgi:hypothetical protein
MCRCSVRPRREDSQRPALSVPTVEPLAVEPEHAASVRQSRMSTNDHSCLVSGWGEMASRQERHTSGKCRL